jgi:hypothetical protein
VCGFSIPNEEEENTNCNIEKAIKQEIKQEIKQQNDRNISFADMKINEIDEDVIEIIDINTVISIKEQGNECYKNNELQDSLDYYSDALHTLSSLEDIDVNVCNEMESSLHFNRAAVFWKQSITCKDIAVSVNNEVDDELECDAPGIFIISSSIFIISSNISNLYCQLFSLYLLI